MQGWERVDGRCTNVVEPEDGKLENRGQGKASEVKCPFLKDVSHWKYLCIGSYCCAAGRKQSKQEELDISDYYVTVHPFQDKDNIQ